MRESLYKKICLFFIPCSFIVFLSVFLVSCSSQEKGPEIETITIWHWMSDREDAFLELAKKYEDEKEIRINFELYAPSEAYTRKIRAAAQTNTLPDIFGIFGEKIDFASFIKAGHIYNLTGYMDEAEGDWRNKLFSKALALNEFKVGNSFNVEPGIYGAPIDVTNIQMLYNKDLLKNVGWTSRRPPESWGEFLEVNMLLKEKGIQGLVSGWGETWMIDCFASNYAFNIMGEEKVLDTIRGRVPYTDPDWIRVFDLFRQMRDEGVLASGVVTMVNKTAEQLFSNNRAAFAFNGSWCVNVYQGMNPDLNYGAMMPPRVSDDFPMMIWGGAGSSFMINKRSPNREKAIGFLKWLTDTEQQVFLAQETLNLPSNKNSLGKISNVLSEFADDMDNITHRSAWEVAEFPIVIETFDKGIQSIIIGEKTPEELASEVQAIKERELRKVQGKRTL
ncbi:ABC transporter substrate-binding protein [Candidatus Omnitrophota bacterium]